DCVVSLLAIGREDHSLPRQCCFGKISTCVTKPHSSQIRMTVLHWWRCFTRVPPRAHRFGFRRKFALGGDASILRRCRRQKPKSCNQNSEHAPSHGRFPPD